MQCLKTIRGVRCSNPTDSHFLYCECHAEEEHGEPPKKTTAVKATYEELEAKVDELTKVILNR